MPPVVATSKYYLISIFREDIFMLATTTGETQPLLVIEFLHRVFEIFEDYFGTVEETTIKENFATVYQLLEEMMDFGYPLTTEPNALKAMIKPNSVLSRLASGVSGRQLLLVPLVLSYPLPLVPLVFLLIPFPWCPWSCLIPSIARRYIECFGCAPRWDNIEYALEKNRCSIFRSIMFSPCRDLFSHLIPPHCTSSMLHLSHRRSEVCSK